MSVTKCQAIKHYNVNELLISNIVTIILVSHFIPYGSQTAVSLLG